jgi:hypothetical protein
MERYASPAAIDRDQNNPAQLFARRCNATPLRGCADDGDIRRSGRRDFLAFFWRHIVKKLIFLSFAAAVAASPAFAALTSNALTSNALTSNALTSNALTSNALTSNALTSNALTSNALTSNALTSNSITHNALTSNALTSNSLGPHGGSAKGGAMVVTGDTVRAITLRSGERVTLH